MRSNIRTITGVERSPWDRIEALVDELATLAGAIEPEACTGPSAARLVRAFDRGERVCAAAKALAARRVELSNLWRSGGARDAAAWLEGETGCSRGSAQAVLERGEAMGALPELARAATAGEVSVDASREIGRTVPKDRAAAPPELGAELVALWEPWVDREFTVARHRGRTEPRDALAFDALLAMARAAAGGPPRAAGARRGVHGASDAALPFGVEPPSVDDSSREDDLPGRFAPSRGDGAAAAPPARFGRSLGSDCKVIVRVDHAALSRGWVEGGELCEIAGVGPVPVATVNAMLASGDPFVVALLTRGVDVGAVVHLGRQARAVQRTALEWLHPVCAWPDCNNRARLEIDHRTPWAILAETTVDGAQRLCSHHHHAVKTPDDLAAIAAHRNGRPPPQPPQQPPPPPGTPPPVQPASRTPRQPLT